jgi:hypothetical protein
MPATEGKVFRSATIELLVDKMEPDLKVGRKFPNLMVTG